MERRAQKWDEGKYEAKKRERDAIAAKIDSLRDLPLLRNREQEINSKLAALQSTIKFNTDDMVPPTPCSTTASHPTPTPLLDRTSPSCPVPRPHTRP